MWISKAIQFLVLLMDGTKRDKINVKLVEIAEALVIHTIRTVQSVACTGFQQPAGGLKMWFGKKTLSRDLQD